MDKQTRIFAPFNAEYPQENWYENILGRVIKPITDNWDLDWFWFSKYVHPLGNNEDCDTSKIDRVYVNTLQGNVTKSVRFRYSIRDAECENFEKEFEKTIKNNSCFITDFRPWDKVGDVGSGRHIGGKITEERQITRAEINTKLYHQISLLTLDVIEEIGHTNHYRMETNNANDIPNPKSSFATPHHLFCNIAQIPLLVIVTVRLQNGNLFLRTETGWGNAGLFGPQAGVGDPFNISINMPVNF